MRPAELNNDNIAGLFPGAGTLVKGLQIIELFAEADSPKTSAELMKATGVPKATLYRLLAALVEFRYLHHDPRLSTYSLGPRFIELARRSLSGFDLRSAAEQELVRLATEIGETASLVALDGDSVIYIDTRRGPHPLAVGIEIGRRALAASAASGQAILAGLPPHEANVHLAALSDEEKAHALSAMAMSRVRGYTIAQSRSIRGVVIIAAPVLGGGGGAKGALVVTALEDRVPPEKQHTIGRDLMEAARRITGNIGAAVSITPNPRRSAHIEEGLVCVLAAGAIVGEGPVWNRRTATLDWVDVLAPSVHAYDPATGRNTGRQAPRLVSAVLPAEGGGHVAMTQQGLEALDFSAGMLTPLLDPEAHLPGNRFNDAKCDRRGRLWSGSMSLDASMPTGSLYRFNDARSAKAMDGGFQVSNGLDWSPDDRTFYFTDSALGTVFAYDFDIESGEISNRRPFLRFAPDAGRPDGLSVDSEGYVWIALWDGWRVARYAPDGRLDREVDLPVPRPSSCCFGGPDLKTLYITSARVRLSGKALEEAPLSGGIFSLAVDTPGQPATEFSR
ncbi:SMP-30/gluconolactonase/LRE family protein [Chelativorans xinjiangense]|uniref:SMP-30/gluconolactonase/LRE family protein n=1 Tax=Chelativorans xinjiangense TaxID=2681485 RepID=UPI0013597042|nr:SMP-30/gluconolactonase/LRE family protein [Chelativorans xinjiangense]